MLEEERLRQIAMIHGRIDSRCYRSSVYGSLGKDSSSNINDVVDHVLAKHKKEHKIISKPNKKLPLRKIIPIALISLLLVLSLPYLLSPLFGDFGSDLKVELNPSNGVYVNDTLYVNLTIPSGYNITMVSADMAGVETIDMLFVDNDSFVQFWQGVWFVHGLVPGEYIININAIDNVNISYSAGVDLSILPELPQPVFNDSVNDTKPPDVNETQPTEVNKTVPPVSLNLTLDVDKFVYVVNETVLISGVVSFNDSLVNTFVNVSVFGPNISWINVLNVSDGLFGYDFVTTNVGDFVVKVSVVYENISVSKELSLVVVETPIENISENISEISIVDQKVREELFVLPGCSFYVERTVVGSDGLQAVFAPLFSDGLTLERFEIVSGNVTRGRSRNIVNDLASGVFISDKGVSGVERHIDNIREHLPSYIKSSDWTGYSGSFVLHEPVTIRVWFRAPSWDDIISGHVPGSGRISYLTFAGDDFDFEGSTWWNSNWLNRKLITINSSQVETDLTNFPILINITDADLRDDAQDDGDDIAFILIDDSTKLNHEIEMFNGSTGQLYTWVNITSLSGSEDTKIWMYYNNSGCTNQENIHGVWDSNFIGVWHFEESSGVAEDSTANELNGSFYGSLPDARSSQIYLGQDFDGYNDYIEVTDPGSGSVLDFDYGDDITISVWIKPTALPSYGCILNKDPYEDMNYGIQNVGQQLNFFYRDSADTYYPEYLTTDNVLSIGTWSYATASYTFGTGSTAKIYIDGTERLASWNVGDGNDAPLLSNNPLWFGADDIGTPGSPDEEFDGIIDEVRISNIIRNSSWISTSYNTMKNQSIFINIETEEYITNTSINSISPYNITYSPYSITATGDSSLDNVTLWYSYSIDNSTWWNSSFTYRKKITIDSSQVVTDLVNFPILINLTDTNLTTKAQNDGDDIAFTNATGTKLNHEIENYNSSTGELFAWVNVTSLSSSVDTVLYLYYGNISCTSQENVAGTWDSDFLIVQHLNESYSTDNDHYKDSTANDHDGTFVGGDGSNSVSGIIDQALSFDGVDTALTLVDSSDFTTPSSATRTYEAWVNLSAAPTGYRNIIGDYHGPCFQFNGNQLNYFAGQQIKSNVLTWTPGTWYYVVCTVNGLTATNWYRDGESVGMETEYTQSIKDPDNFWIGADENNEYFNGVIDEVRLSTKIRTLGWIQTCYNNQINSSSFYSLGTEEIWIQWNNVTNPDTSSPWSWDFDFPNGTGYYEFYSISKKSGSPDEIPPTNADAICYFNESLNTQPVIILINPQPNGTTGVSLQPICQVWANDSDGDTLTVYWYENTTGSWVLRNTNNSISANTIVSYNFTQFINYSITYWWKVAINDSIDNISSWFYFKTEPINTSVDTIDPYDQSTFLLTINSTGISDIDNVTLYYRWSEDNSSWGVGIQDISIYEGFESGTQNTSLWNTYQTASSNARIQWNYGTAHSGSYSCAMDDADTDAGDYALNVIYTNYDFTGASNINIDFWEREWGDEAHDAPNSWTGWGNYDVVAFTNDGNTWYEIVPEASLNIETFTNFQYNISADPDFISPPNSSFAIAFQQYDNYQLTSDGRAWDDIYINFTIGGVGINWTLWNDASNPDNSYPWSWNFDFPNQTGYYQFYSIGKKSGEIDEDPPSIADAICYNNPTTMVDPIIPYNQTTSPITITATGDSGFDNVTLYYRYSQDNITWVKGSGDIIWSSELLTNPGFETGDTTGWTNGGGGTMTVGTDCPYGSQGPDGTYYAYWIQNNWNVNSYAYQNVSLDSYASYIDAGLAKINVTGWFVSDEYNAGPPPFDESFMNVRFYNASDENMSGCWYESGGTNPVSQGSGNNLNSWTQYGITNYTIPVGARKIQIRFFCWEYAPIGPVYWDSGSAENFSVTVGIEDYNWTIIGTDTNYPWSWEFNFPNGTGYYEFYTIGNKSGWPNETKPDNADAMCKYNNQPTISNEVPSNESVGIPLTPQMNITVNDTDGDSMTVTWYSNSSGSWQIFGINYSAVNGTYYQTNVNYTSTGKTYWWYVTVTDGIDTNTSAIFHFTTTEIAPPQVTSNSSTGVEETNATLWGYLYDEGGESCTARFEYGTTTSYGTNTTNQTISEGEEFSAGINSLTPGQIYHYRAYANNTYGSDTGSDITFLTKPQPPTSLNAQANNSTTIYLTWTVGTGANTTYIERNTSSSWALGEATVIYNGSAAFYENTGLTQGITYYYQAWSYSTWTEISTLFQWSDTNASASNTTNNRPTCTVISPINASTNVNLQPICEIWANDTDGDLLTVNWYEYTTGSWVLRQTNTSVEANSTLNWTYSQANAYGITYYWKITINDSIDNTTFLYYFTSEPINTSVDTISPYVVNTSPLTINATNTTQVDNVTLYYRWSNDNITWSTPIPGMITDSIISEYEWDAQEGRQPVVCRVNSSEYYLIATAGSTGSDYDGWARVIRVYNDNGSIQQPRVSSYEFDDSDGNYPCIVHLPGTDKYAISYRDTTGDRVKVVTLQVSDVTGIITQSVIDSQSLTYDGLYTNMILVSPDEPLRSGWIFAIAYQEGGTGGAGATNDGFMETIWIDNTGMINNTIMSTKEFDTAECYYPILAKVDTDTVAICYTTSGSDGYVSTWNITSSGIIGTTMADGWEYDISNGQYPSFIKINGNVFAVAYRDTDTYGYVKTFNISNTGMITKTFVDSLTFTGTMVNAYNYIFPIVQGSVYGISFQGLDADGYIYSMNISSNGIIGNAIIDSIEFDIAYNAYFANLIDVNSSYYLVVYQGSGDDGWAKTVGINNDLGWMKWTDVSNPDTSSPWSWNFNFQNGTGYYQFYSIGKKSGSTDESIPDSPDAICVYNRIPTITNEGPTNESIDIPVYPQLNITVNDLDGDKLNITWYSNSSGSWQVFGTNNSVSNGTYHQNNTNFSLYYTTFWWNVTVSDGFNTNTSETFHFTTEHSTLIDIIPDHWDIGSTTIGNYNYSTSGFYFNLTNNGTISLDIQIKASNATNATTGAQWNLSSTPGFDNYSLQYNKSLVGPWININQTYDTFVSNLGIDSWQTFDLNIFMATTSTKSDPLSVTITFRSVIS